MFFKRGEKEEKKKNRGRNDPRIPDDLKYTLTDPILERLSELLDIEGQTFRVRKYLKYPPGKSKPEHVFLPAKDKPHEFRHPPTVNDILNVFPEYGGGVYQVYATKPQPQFVYSLSIDWIEPKEPFRKEKKEDDEEDEEVGNKRRSKKKPDIMELLSSDGVDQKIKSRLLVAYIAKEVGLDPNLVIGSEEPEDPINKAISEYLKKHPDVMKDIVAKKIKQIFGIEDEVDKAERWMDFLSRFGFGNPMMGYPPQDPFMTMLQWFVPVFMPLDA